MVPAPVRLLAAARALALPPTLPLGRGRSCGPHRSGPVLSPRWSGPAHNLWSGAAWRALAGAWCRSRTAPSGTRPPVPGTPWHPPRSVPARARPAPGTATTFLSGAATTPASTRVPTGCSPTVLSMTQGPTPGGACPAPRSAPAHRPALPGPGASSSSWAGATWTPRWCCRRRTGTARPLSPPLELGKASLRYRPPGATRSGSAGRGAGHGCSPG